MRKTIITVLVIAIMLFSFSATAFADDTPITGNDSVVEVTLQVEPLDLKATVTLSSYFEIDPNVEGTSAFVTPTITAKNDSTAPLRFSVVSLKAVDDAPKVVTDSTFTDTQWLNLGKTDTKANISLGFKNPAASPNLPTSFADGSPVWTGMWFANEAAQSETTLFDVEGGASRPFEMQAKFGRAWDAAYAFKYNCVMKVSLI